jgi:hypothetical protein
MLFVCRCAPDGHRVQRQPVCQPAEVPWRALVTARTLAGLSIAVGDVVTRHPRTGVLEKVQAFQTSDRSSRYSSACCGGSSMGEHMRSKHGIWVRFPASAPQVRKRL